jgi:tetratricopeptide (TPR) repeat protein
MIKKFVALFILFCSFQVKAQVTRDSLDHLLNRMDTIQANFNTKFALLQNILKLAVSKKDTAYIIHAYQKLGDLFWFDGAYSRSEDYYYKSLLLTEVNKYSKEYAYALYSIGWIECVQKKNTNRIYLLKKALSVYKNINDKFGVVSVYNALSGVYSSLAVEGNNTKNIDSSILYLEQAIDFCRKDEKLNKNTENLVSNLAEQYFLKNDFSKANAIITELLNSKNNNKNKRIYAQSIVIKSKVYFATHKIDSCLALLSNNLQQIENYSYNEVLKDAYNYLYLSYNAKKNMRSP